eukprot:2590433-Pleurochrysis_carterae.AAC.1
MRPYQDWRPFQCYLLEYEQSLLQQCAGCATRLFSPLENTPHAQAQTQHACKRTRGTRASAHAARTPARTLTEACTGDSPEPMGSRCQKQASKGHAQCDGVLVKHAAFQRGEVNQWYWRLCRFVPVDFSHCISDGCSSCSHRSSEQLHDYLLT